ncbi:MAG: arsenic resistance N-acetyltransferase ArsN2 [Gammaproteobacteria bacterium]|nr:arsenic resistance N-acetyltransferase ArsN2 [Gammaproteobacteria bacterium]
MLRPASSSDLNAIAALLAEFGLPTRGVVDFLDTFVVAELKGRLVGVGGIETHGNDALLRSLAVSPENQHCGIATAICDHLEAQAAQLGMDSIYILTETAEQFFAGRGYAVVARSVAPEAIAASEEFSDLCPQSATFMSYVYPKGTFPRKHL